MYIPPDGDKVDFYLEVFDPPGGDEADFQLLEDESIVRVNAHVSLNLSMKARGTLPLALIYKVEHVEELKTSSGTWKCPHGIVDNKLLVECWGKGGNGAGGSDRYRGGGGGAFASATVDVVPSKSYNYTTAGSEGTLWDDGSEVKAARGENGTKSVPGDGGKAVDCKGTVKYSGGNAAYGGGGGAGSNGPGKNAAGDAGGVATEEYGGAGGAAGSGAPYNYRAKNGFNYGGGGGGGYGYDVAGHYFYDSGGSGAPGLIRLTYDKLVAVPLSAHVSLYMGVKAQAETKSLAATRSYTDMFGIIRSRKR